MTCVREPLSPLAAPATQPWPYRLDDEHTIALEWSGGIALFGSSRTPFFRTAATDLVETAADWYEVVQGPVLAQGDVLMDCPVPLVEQYTHPLPDDGLTIAVDSHHLVILSQSCDLENNKIDEVLLAGVIGYQEAVANEASSNPFIGSKKWRAAAARGDMAGQAVLPPFDGTPSLDWSIVDFHHLFTLPKTYLEQFAGSGQGRLRLVSPYREHIAQAFARYVMRVGLPTPLHEFEKFQP